MQHGSLITSQNALSGSLAVYTQGGERSTRWMAAASRSSPASMTRIPAYGSSSGLSIIMVLFYLHFPVTSTIHTLDTDCQNS